MSPDPPSTGTRLTALPVEDLVRLLVASGSRVISEDLVRSDLQAGAPTNADGTINLICYAAWLMKRERRGA